MIQKIGSGNLEYFIRLFGIVGVILILLIVALHNTLVLARENQAVLATATLQPTPTATAQLQVAVVMATLQPTPTAVLETLEPPNDPPWQPNEENAEWYRRQCVSANGVIHPVHHELAVGKIIFFPDYPAAETLPSCNYADYGVNQPQAIVLHFTDYGTLSGVVSWFRKLDGLSAHYLIDREGVVYQMVPELLGARHVSCAGGACLASCPADLCGEGYPELKSIGIELLNYGYVDPITEGIAIYEDYQAAFGRRYWEDYPDMQLEALRALVCDIAKRWGIPIDAEHVLGHYRINQKVDPGPALNLFWERLGSPYRPPLFAGGCE